MVSISDSNRFLAHREAALSVISDLIESHEQRISAKQLTIAIDVEDLCSAMGTSPSLIHHFESMLTNAVEDCAKYGEVSITVLDTLRGIEIEVADSASSPSATADYEAGLSRAAFSGHQPPLARSSGASRWGATHADLRVSCTRCPQGGLAWTFVAGKSMMAKRAA